MAVLSVDLPQLKVWTRTGDAKRRLVYLSGFAQVKLTINYQKTRTNDSGGAEPSELATGVADLVVGNGGRGTTLNPVAPLHSRVLGRVCRFIGLCCDYRRNPPTGNHASICT